MNRRNQNTRMNNFYNNRRPKNNRQKAFVKKTFAKKSLVKRTKKRKTKVVQYDIDFMYKIYRTVQNKVDPAITKALLRAQGAKIRTTMNVEKTSQFKKEIMEKDDYDLKKDIKRVLNTLSEHNAKGAMQKLDTILTNKHHLVDDAAQAFVRSCESVITTSLGDAGFKEKIGILNGIAKACTYLNRDVTRRLSKSFSEVFFAKLANFGKNKDTTDINKFYSFSIFLMLLFHNKCIGRKFIVKVFKEIESIIVTENDADCSGKFCTIYKALVRCLVRPNSFIKRETVSKLKNCAKTRRSKFAIMEITEICNGTSRHDTIKDFLD